MNERPPTSDEDEAPRLGGSGRGPVALQLTVRVGGVPVDNRTSGPAASVLPDYPIGLAAAKDGQGFVVEGSGERARLGPEDAAAFSAGRIEVEVTPVQRFRLPRWSMTSVDPTLVTLILTISLLAAQLSLLVALYQAATSGGGGGGFEPTPEYIARLLRGETDGEDKGVIAQSQPRPKGGEKIEGFYLQPGSAGPATHVGGGKNVGRTRKIGDVDAKPDAGGAPPAAPLAGDQPSDEPVPVAADEADRKDPGAEEDEGEDHPVAVEITEGWGFSDWYDTEDARQDAQEIQQQLELARARLRLDPDDPAGLQVRAYYEYLAMDYKAARKTYEKFTRLYPDDASGWNNLALTYKRTKEYEKEEQLYRVALSYAPNDDAPLNNLAVCLAHQGRYEEALQIMKELETIIPGDPYADLHRAKIYAAWGKEDKSYSYLQKSLAGMKKLDTLHNIEFRQDIRLDPAFEQMRGEKRFRDLLLRYYGDRPEGWWQKLTQ